MTIYDEFTECRCEGASTFYRNNKGKTEAFCTRCEKPVPMVVPTPLTGAASMTPCVETDECNRDLSDEAKAAVAEGQADHAAGRTATLEQVKKDPQ